MTNVITLISNPLAIIGHIEGNATLPLCVVHYSVIFIQLDHVFVHVQGVVF